jgi:hypothetical protein
MLVMHAEHGDTNDPDHALSSPQMQGLQQQKVQNLLNKTRGRQHHACSRRIRAVSHLHACMRVMGRAAWRSAPAPGTLLFSGNSRSAPRPTNILTATSSAQAPPAIDALIFWALKHHRQQRSSTAKVLSSSTAAAPAAIAAAKAPSGAPAAQPTSACATAVCPGSSKGRLGPSGSRATALLLTAASSTSLTAHGACSSGPRRQPVSAVAG